MRILYKSISLPFRLQLRYLKYLIYKRSQRHSSDFG